MLCTDHNGKTFNGWRVPPIGSPAEDDIPDWMIELMLEGTIEINDFGGLTSLQDPSLPKCFPGDIILIDDEEIIQFCPERTFDEQYTVH